MPVFLPAVLGSMPAFLPAVLGAVPAFLPAALWSVQKGSGNAVTFTLFHYMYTVDPR